MRDAVALAEQAVREHMPMPPATETMMWRRHRLHILTCTGTVDVRHADTMAELQELYWAMVMEAIETRNVSRIGHGHREHIRMLVAVTYHTDESPLAGQRASLFHSGAFECLEGHVTP